ncbi:hypothetical protein GPALN_013141 [Globodera pallida]|nr:hypothetical protein GPALN_013141 [Globodera pallida]
MNSSWSYVILIVLMLIEGFQPFITTQRILSSPQKKTTAQQQQQQQHADPFVTCTKQHSLATCCWRFPEIDDCPSEDEEEYDDKSFKSNEKIKPNFIEFEKDDWLKPYGDEFFS